jgi:hypothetical protein
VVPFASTSPPGPVTRTFPLGSLRFLIGI